MGIHERVQVDPSTKSSLPNSQSTRFWRASLTSFKEKKNKRKKKRWKKIWKKKKRKKKKKKKKKKKRNKQEEQEEEINTTKNLKEEMTPRNVNT